MSKGEERVSLHSFFSLIAPDASVRELSHLMLSEKVHRVLVIENGEVMGIVRSEEVTVEQLGLMMAGERAEQVFAAV